MARDRLFAHQATRVNAGGTPTVALFLSTLVAFAFLLSGTFTTVLDLTAVLMVVQYLLMFVVVVVLRRREPKTPRPYRAWGISLDDRHRIPNWRDVPHRGCRWRSATLIDRAGFVASELSSISRRIDVAGT